MFTTPHPHLPFDLSSSLHRCVYDRVTVYGWNLERSYLQMFPDIAYVHVSTRLLYTYVSGSTCMSV